MRYAASILDEIYQRAWEKFEELGFLREDLDILIKDRLTKMKMANVLNRYMSTREVAQGLSLHPDTVRKFCREGKLRSIKIGGRYRVRELDLLTFVREREWLYAYDPLARSS